MASDRTRRVWEVFSEALERPTNEREAFIETACANDDELKTSVHSLLLDEVRSRDFLATPLVESSPVFLSADPEPSPDFPPGTKVGQYTLHEVIGRGGMGTVYRASQDYPERTVAVKFLLGALATPGTARRFANEAHFLARLQHVGIAQVYNAGTHATPAGVRVPYFVMEHIEDAVTITDYCDSHGMGLRERLVLFAKACDAIHHAHQCGVIHRDLKPANILVGASRQPKVVDFGVARLLEGDGTTATRTHAGMVVGTLAYMAPEQCAGNPADVGVRSDVYALGAVLYELLCGRPPHELGGLSLSQAVHRLCEGAIPRPSAVAPTVTGDLEVILRHALEREPGSRYESAAELAGDLRRWLERRPIRARRTGPLHRARLLAVRHPWGFATSAVGLIAFTTACVALIATLSQLAVAELEARTVRSEHIQAEENLRFLDPDCGDGVFVGGLTRAEARAANALALYANSTGSSPLIELRSEAGVVRQDAPQFAVPPGLAESGPEPVFVFRWGLMADVFPDSPGREFVALFGELTDVPEREHKIHVLRVYDLNLRILREVWVPAGVRSWVWDARSRKLILTLDLNSLQYCAPALAAYDARWCCDRPVGVCAVVAIQPSEIDDGVLFSIAPQLEGTLIATAWTLVRVPQELVDPSSTHFVSDMSVGHPDPARSRAVCKLSVEISTETRPGQARSGPTRRAEAHLDRSGRVIDGFRSLDGNNDVPLKLLFSEFERIDLPAAARGVAAAARVTAACKTLEEAEHILRADSSIPSSVAPHGLRAVTAMMNNWRWLNKQASAILEASPPPTDPRDLDRALAWARLGTSIHDSRCPNPAECRASWYMRDTLAFALYRNGQYTEALQTVRECQGIWKTEFPSPPFSPGNAHEIALEAMCLHHLGHRTEALTTLESAIAAEPVSDAHGGYTLRVLAEARDLIRGTPP